jgi:hypothetical protein
MRYLWRLEVLSSFHSPRYTYSKDKSLIRRSAASWRKSGYPTKVERVTISRARKDDLHCRLFGWPLIPRDRGRLNNSRSFRRYQAGITRPMFYKHATITINGEELSQDSITYTDKS